ncbi:DNA gyrase subunit A [Paenibacillus pabuli]|uniref:DNA gyrase subunit A n=1 Tax=Paenibacillus pabuli TaxID=1472 RepID=UPI00324300AE
MSFVDPKEVRDEHLVKTVADNTKAYAEKVNFDRAMPYSSDGNKPVFRFIMESIFQLTGKNKNLPVKASKVNSNVIGDYHPHGDAGVHEALADSMKDYVSLIDGPEIAPRTTTTTKAARYVDVNFTPLGMEYMSNRHMAAEGESYSGVKMPLSFRPRFPYQLMRSSFSIGVGFEGLELPWNPVEVIEAQIAMIKARKENRQVSTEELAQILKGPDLYKNHTAYMSTESLHSLIDGGIGSITVVAKIDVQGKEIIIRETPYREHSPNVAESIRNKARAFHANKSTYNPKNRNMIRGLIDISGEKQPAKDFSQGEDIKIVCYMDGSVPAERLLNDLYSKTNLKRAYLMKYVQIVEDEDGNKLIALVPLRSIISSTIDNNIEFYQQKYQAEIDKLEREFVVNIAMEKATRPEHIDEVLLAMKSKNKLDLLLGIKTADFTQEEAELVVNQRATRFSDRDRILLEIDRFEGKKNELIEKLKLENILTETLNYIQHTILPLVKNKTRRTEIIYTALSHATPQIKTHVEVNSVYVNIDGNNIWKTNYQVQDCRSIEIKENSHVIAMTADKFVKIPVDEIAQQASSALNYVGERVYSLFTLSPKLNKVMLFLNSNGSMKSMLDERVDTRVNSIASAPITEGSITTFELDSEDELDNHVLAIVTKFGYTKTITLERFTPKDRKAGYLRVTKLKEGDSIVWAQLVPKGFVGATIEINDKRFEVDEYTWEQRIETLGLELPDVTDVENVNVQIGTYTFTLEVGEQEDPLQGVADIDI